MGIRIGIDLGTTNSAVAYMKGGAPQVLANLQGDSWTPSVVQDFGGRLLVGKEARENLPYAPGDTVWSIKRFIGRSAGDPQFERARRLVSYRVDNPPPGKTELVVHLGARTYTPTEISAMILRRLAEDVAATLGEQPSGAVITVPAYFTERQKAATREAGALAGLKLLMILDEPTAAALAYGVDLDAKAEKTVLVFDLGGGTFDISALLVTGGLCTTLSIAGDNFLGGDDFDNVLVEHLLSNEAEQRRRQCGGPGGPRVPQRRRDHESARRRRFSQVDAFIRLRRGRCCHRCGRARVVRRARARWWTGRSGGPATAAGCPPWPTDVDQVLMVEGFAIPQVHRA